MFSFFFFLWDKDAFFLLTFGEGQRVKEKGKETEMRQSVSKTVVMCDSGWLHLQSWISRKTHEHYWSQQNRIEKEDKKPQVQKASIQFIIKWGKGTLTSSFDIYISRKGLLILNTPHYWPSHSCNKNYFVFPKNSRMSFSNWDHSKVSSLCFPFPQPCSEVNTDNANNEIVRRKAST